MTPGWVYPCTVDDLRGRLADFDAADLSGLHAVGLVPATRKDHWADARYFHGPPAVIHIYSLPVSLSFRMPPRVQRAWLETSTAASYGMRFQKQGSRWTCTWSPEDLRRFILDYVLAHEVGHHVYHLRRGGAAWNRRVSEQFAHAYGVRHAAPVSGR